MLLLEDEEGRGRLVSGVQLGTGRRRTQSLRLAVSRADGARTSIDDRSPVSPQAWSSGEIPAVIGMQFEITDHAAIVFGGELYAALADAYPRPRPPRRGR